MRCIFPLMFILIFISCKKNEEVNLSFVEFCSYKERDVLKATSIAGDAQKLFLNYKLHLSRGEFDKITKENIKTKVLVEEKSSLKFPLHTDSNPYPYYFNVYSGFDNDSLKSISLTVKCYINENSNRYQQSHYSYYYDLLTKKYGKTNAEYIDDRTSEAFWISNNVVISIREEEILKTDYYTPEQEFVNLAISYEELKQVQKTYREDIFERKKAEKKKQKIDKRQRDSLKEQNVLNKRAF